jgi:sodium transport system ATP-binding protein
MIRVEGLEKRFAAPAPAWSLRRAAPAAPLVAVDGVSFEAADGRITGLLGPNGAGKTTTLRMVAGLIVPDVGRVSVGGIDVGRDPRAALRQLGVLSDARGLYPRLSARENIVYYAALHGMGRDAAQARAEVLADALDMRSLLDRRTEGFSQGERMKTALARALVHDPAHLMLATRSLRETLRHLCSPAGGGKCIVLSSHIMQEVERLCDQVVVIACGRNVAEGTVAALCARTGEADFEEAFVRLAFGDSASPTAVRIGGAPA